MVISLTSPVLSPSLNKHILVLTDKNSLGLPVLRTGTEVDGVSIGIGGYGKVFQNSIECISSSNEDGGSEGTEERKVMPSLSATDFFC